MIFKYKTPPHAVQSTFERDHVRLNLKSDEVKKQILDRGCLRCDNQVRAVEKISSMHAVLKCLRCQKYGHIAARCNRESALNAPVNIKQKSVKKLLTSLFVPTARKIIKQKVSSVRWRAAERIASNTVRSNCRPVAQHQSLIMPQKRLTWTLYNVMSAAAHLYYFLHSIQPGTPVRK